MSSPSNTILRTFLIACLSSATTIIIFLFLLRPGSNNIITTVVDHVRTSPEELLPSSNSESAQIDATSCTSGTKPAIDSTKSTFPKKFLEDPWKADPYDMNGNDAQQSENLTKETWWDRLLTPNGGFLMVLEDEKDQMGQNHEAESANKPTSAPEPVGYGVSMFHQLHCLDMIRRRLLEEIEGEGNSQAHAHDGAMPVHNHQRYSKRDQLSTEGDTSEPGTVDGEQEEQDRAEKLRKFETMHLLHCLEYIAQAIICAADDALESSEPTELGNGEEVNGVNGENEIHQCKNASVLYDFVARSRDKPVRRKDMGRYSVFP
ncbi:protein of unknown function (DUF3328) domain containing protein [Naviculisporaceae sp. PSN 640]